MSGRRVVVTGLGWASSLGDQVDQVWEKLLRGTSGIHPIQRFDTGQYSVKFGGEMSDWKGGRHLAPRDCKRMDRFAQFALSSAIDAVDDAGVSFDREDPFRCGVVVGSGIGGIEEFEIGHAKMLEKGPSRVSPMMIPKLMINAASGHISIHYGLQGPNAAAVTACASGGHAIADAFNLIRNNEADVMLTGGAEAALTPLGLACFMTMRALSTRNDDPAGASRPFDRERDGFIMAEGAGMLVLEDYEHARARGAHIHAEVLGYGMSGDGTHITAPDEQGRGAREAMDRALRVAQLDPGRISYVNAHATSTQLGDLAENRAIKSIFEGHNGKPAVSSTKSMTGHTLGAAGGLETVILCKAVQSGDLPPTINLDDPDDGCDLNYVPNEAQHHDVQYAMSNNFGFGGHNVSLVIGRI